MRFPNTAGCLSLAPARARAPCALQSDSDDDGDDLFNAESLYDSFKKHLHSDWDDGLFDDDESDGEEYIPKQTGRKPNQKYVPTPSAPCRAMHG